MSRFPRTSIKWIIVILVICLSGCSSSNNDPLTPCANESAGGRILWGAWDVRIDTDTSEITATEVRSGEYHYNLSKILSPPNCPDCIDIELKKIIPGKNYIEVAVTLKNPTGVTGYDVRGIAMSQYEGFTLLNADGYTDIWDDGGPVKFNPFLAFAVEEPNRKFTGHAEHSRVYEIEYSELNKVIETTLVADASWPGNCREPYDIIVPEEPVVFTDLEYGEISCQVKAWDDDVKSVSLAELDCLGIDKQVEMVYQGDDVWLADGLQWHQGGGSVGDYKMMVVAKTEGSAMYLVDYIDVELAATQEHDGWALTIGGTTDDIAYAIDTDADGNIYVAGSFSNDVDFDPGPGVYELSADGTIDAFLCKYNPQGEFAWAVSWGGPWSNETDYAYDVEIDSSGGVYVIGEFEGTSVDFDPGSGEEMRDSNGAFDVFLVKYDTDGVFQWVRTWGGINSDAGYGVTSDSNDYVYVTGSFRGNVDFDPGDGVDEHDAGYYPDIFLSSFDADGEFRWVRTWGYMGGSTNYDEGYGVVADTSGNIYATGRFYNNVDFDPGEGSDEKMSQGYSDAFVSSFTSDGDYQWSVTWGGTKYESSDAITVDFSGNIYVTGYYNGQVDFDPGPDEFLVTASNSDQGYMSSFNPGGDFRWVRVWGGSMSSAYSQGIATDGSNNIYVTGYFYLEVDFDLPDGNDTHSYDNIFNSFLACFDLSGNFSWARSWGGVDSLDASQSNDVVVSPDGNVYLDGYFFGDIDLFFGPGEDVHVSNGLEDVFVIKMSSDGLW